MTDDDMGHASAVAEQLRQAKEDGDLPASTAERSSIRLAVDGDLLDVENPIDYLVMLLLEGKRYDGNWYGDETEVARWAIAQWCQETGCAPDLRDYDAGEQVERGDELDCLDAAFYDHADVHEEGADE
ncbi:hypothetical protein DJ73_13070 [Halorubrum sp. Ea1]|uniref:hypothetical protein n=1 Tax=Halorubrum sp. Ea1 TaxID=1480718 RepID=UPI000B990CF0|nr:hypothetical protein [Halorubrum sp. Ea1]OYR51523.1 hypothetical protein DJ73_13070 [Halorubrum sp. Ea1]